MAKAIRGHLLAVFLLLVVLGIWANDAADVPESQVASERLQEDLEALSGGSLSADEVPALAQWMFRDTQQPQERRLQVLGAAVDAKLRHQIRLPARVEEDPLALLALVLEPSFRHQLQSDCPGLPAALSVICDPREWALFEQSVGRALLELMDRPQDFAAASRVGGNDLSLQAADALCGMDEAGLKLAKRQVKEAKTERGAVLGVLAAGCAGDRTLEPGLLQEWVDHPTSRGIRLAAGLECAARLDCSLPRGQEAPKDAVEALLQFAGQIQEGTP